MQSGVARGTDLRGVERLRWKLDVGIAAAMKDEFPVAPARANDFTFPRDVDEIIIDGRGTFSKFRVSGTLDSNPIEQTHALIHRPTEIRDGRGLDGFEMLDEVGRD